MFSLLLMSALDVNERKLALLLYQRYKHAMFDAAYDIIKDDGLAEDAIHTTFVDISNHLHKLCDIDSVRTKAYLLTAVKNTAKKMFNNRKCVCGYVETNVKLTDVSADSTPEKIVLRKLSQLRMEKCLMEMTPKYRDILIMKYYMENDDRIIAKAFGISCVAVRKRLERARKEFIVRYGGVDIE